MTHFKQCWMVRDNHMVCEESLISVSVYGDTLNAERHLKINSLKQLVCLNTKWTWSTASQVHILKTAKNAFTLFSVLLTWAMRRIYFAITVFFRLAGLVSYSSATACICIFSHPISWNMCVCLLYRFTDMNFNTSLQNVNRRWRKIFV